MPPRPAVKSVSFVRYKPTPDQPQQMESLERVQEHDDQRLSQNWRDAVTVASKYEQDRPEYVKLLQEFENMLDGHIGQKTTIEHRNKLTSKDVRPVHNFAHRAGPKARQFVTT